MSAVTSISAVTLGVADMDRSVRFYRDLGFEVRAGGAAAAFTTLAAGPVVLNLELDPAESPGRPWGRIIFHVDDVDRMWERADRAGHRPEAPPRDAEWGERYFHLRDPDGHELSFARPLG